MDPPPLEIGALSPPKNSRMSSSGRTYLLRGRWHQDVGDSLGLGDLFWDPGPKFLGLCLGGGDCPLRETQSSVTQKVELVPVPSLSSRWPHLDHGERFQAHNALNGRSPIWFAFESSRPLGLVSPLGLCWGRCCPHWLCLQSSLFGILPSLVPLFPDGDCTIYFYPGTDATQELGSCSPEPLFL